MIRAVRQSLRSYANPDKAQILQRFFKTGKGEYAEGDQFLGVVVPHIRKVAKQFGDLDLSTVLTLLSSPIHEERLLAVLVLVRQYQRGTAAIQDQIVKAYLANLEYVNNWDLVDSSAPYILGADLFKKNKKQRALLSRLVSLPRLWDRRVAMISTFHFIKHGDFTDTLKLARRLLKDPEDLMHKAVGWMLREVGKQDQMVLEEFLTIHGHKMPRTMLRYAIERFPERKRQVYLKGIT
jgi:3-methyladenine DNA glycosylase AlkD